MITKFKVKVRETTESAQNLSKALEEATAPDKLPERAFEVKITLEADYDTVQKVAKYMQELGKSSSPAK